MANTREKTHIKKICVCVCFVWSPQSAFDQNENNHFNHSNEHDYGIYRKLEFFLVRSKVELNRIANFNHNFFSIRNSSTSIPWQLKRINHSNYMRRIAICICTYIQFTPLWLWTWLGYVNFSCMLFQKNFSHWIKCAPHH